MAESSTPLLTPAHVALATVFLVAVITSSLITRYDWVALEKSISEIVGVLTPTQSNLVYLAYGRTRSRLAPRG